MATVDQLNVATRNYIDKISKKLIDSVFAESPLLGFAKKHREKAQKAWELEAIAATGCSPAEATIARRTVDVFISDDDVGPEPA